MKPKGLKEEVDATVESVAKEDIEKLSLPFEISPANVGQNSNPWAFSADSFFTGAKMSRITHSLNFNDRYDLRVGILNDAKYNFLISLIPGRCASSWST